MTEKKTPPDDTLSRIQRELVACREIRDLADPMRDISLTIGWLQIMVEHALKESIYRNTFAQTPPKLPLPRVSEMLAEDVWRHAAFGEKPVAQDVPEGHLRALLGAIRSLEGTAWAVRVASDMLQGTD